MGSHDQLHTRNVRHLNTYFKNLISNYCVTISWVLSFWEVGLELNSKKKIKNVGMSSISHYIYIVWTQNYYYDIISHH